MTVKELRDKLQEFDDDTDVVIYLRCEEGMGELHTLSIVRHYKYEDDDEEADDEEDVLPYVKGDSPWLVLDNKDKSFLMLSDG